MTAASPTRTAPTGRVTLRPDPSSGSGPRVHAVVGWPGARPLLADVIPLGAMVVDAHVALGEELALPALRDRVADEPSDSHWVLAAKSALRDELDTYRTALTAAAVRTAGGDVGRSTQRHAAAVARFAAVRDVAAAAREDGVPVLTVVLSELHRLVQATT
jgi:glutamate dehydrogenase